MTTFSTLENFGHSLKLSAKRLFIFTILVAVILSSCQSASKRETDIENKDSPILKMLIDPKDLPSWFEALTTINQPSKAEWLLQENLSDSAASYLKGDYSVGNKRYYISIFHNVAQYSQPVAEMALIQLHSVFDENKEVALFNLQNFGDMMVYKCFDSEIFYDCTVNIRYPNIESFVTVIVEKGFGIGELESLLNSILSIINSKITGS
jgi:hypothetical protein